MTIYCLWASRLFSYFCFGLALLWCRCWHVSERSVSWRNRRVLGHSLVHSSFVRTTYFFACSALLAALICLVIHSRARGDEALVYDVNTSILYSSTHSLTQCSVPFYDLTVGLGGVDIPTLAARGDMLVNSATHGIGLGGVESHSMEEMQDDGEDDIEGRWRILPKVAYFTNSVFPGFMNVPWTYSSSSSHLFQLQLSSLQFYFSTTSSFSSFVL